MHLNPVHDDVSMKKTSKRIWSPKWTYNICGSKFYLTIGKETLTWSWCTFWSPEVSILKHFVTCELYLTNFHRGVHRETQPHSWHDAKSIYDAILHNKINYLTQTKLADETLHQSNMKNGNRKLEYS